jgi:hypothetical protein
LPGWRLDNFISVPAGAVLLVQRNGGLLVINAPDAANCFANSSRVTLTGAI